MMYCWDEVYSKTPKLLDLAIAKTLLGPAITKMKRKWPLMKGGVGA